MTTRWVKLLRDVVVARGRLSMVVAALTISLCAVVTMLSAHTVLRREVPRSYIGSNPASAQLALADTISTSALEAVRRLPNVAAAELATTVSARIDVGGGEWLSMLLFVVPSFDSLRINTVHVDSGVWPAPPGTILIERSAMALAHASVGGSVRVDLGRAGQRLVTIAATVHDPGVAPAWQEQIVYGYVTAATLAALGRTAPLDVLKLFVRNGGTDVDEIERTVRNVSRELAVRGVHVLDARIPPPQQHPHQSQMNAIVTMLLAFSLLVMVLGAVLTGGVISAWLAQQSKQLAIMKAIGARSVQITTLYLALVAALGTVATAAGVPLGLLAGRQFIGIVSTLLNLRLESVGTPWWVVAVALLLGIGAPLLATLIPIRNASRRTVRDAIDDSSARPSAADANPIVRAIARWRLPDAALTLAFRNTFRRRARLVMTAALLAGAGAMFIASLDLRAAWERNVAEAKRDRRFQLEVRLRDAAPAPAVIASLRSVPGVKLAEAWPTAYASRGAAEELEISRSYPDGAHGGVTLRAAMPSTALISHRMAEGRWLRDADTSSAVVNSMAKVLSFRDLRVGDSVSLRVNHRPVVVRIVGVMREPLTPGTLFVTPAFFAAVTGVGDRVNAARLQLTDTSATSTVSRAVTTALAAAGMPLRSVISEARFASAQAGHVYILVYALGFIATLMAIVGLIGLASSLGVSVLERTREFGVMRAIGCSTAMIVRTVVAEGVIIAAVSAVVAIVVSRAVSLTVGRVLASIAAQELTLRLSAGGVAVWVIGLMVGTVIVSSIPAVRAARLTVRAALSHV